MEDYLMVSFSISQTNAKSLIIAIKNRLNITSQITIDSTSNFEIKGTSINTINSVINFIHNNTIKLQGHKKF